MFRIFSIATAIAAALSVPIIVSSGTSAGSVPSTMSYTHHDVRRARRRGGRNRPTARGRSRRDLDDELRQLEHPGTVLFAETMAPTNSTQPGWWLRLDVTVRNNGEQPIEVTDLGITTDASALDIEPLATPVVIGPGNTELSKPAQHHGQRHSADMVHHQRLRTGGRAVPCPSHVSARRLRRRHGDGRLPVPSVRLDDLPAVFWTPGGFHKHSRSQRYAYDLDAIRWDHDLGQWKVYTEQAYDDAGQRDRTRLEERALPRPGPTRYAMASGWSSLSCRRSEPDHLPGNAAQRSRGQLNLDRPRQWRVRGVRATSCSTRCRSACAPPKRRSMPVTRRSITSPSISQSRASSSGSSGNSGPSTC